MRILLIGGAGFIGSQTALRLLELGHEPLVLDLLDPQIHGDEPLKSPTCSLLAGRVEIRQGDTRDREAVEQAMRGVEAVYYLPAGTGTGHTRKQLSTVRNTNRTHWARPRRCAGRSGQGRPVDWACHQGSSPRLPRLRRLSLAHNGLTSLGGLGALQGGPLEWLDVRDNALGSLAEVSVLAGLPHLAALQVAGGAPGVLPGSCVCGG